MIHYFGTPITPRQELLRLAGRHFCVSYARPDSLSVCMEIGQSLMLDNGAFTFWRQGGTVDPVGYAEWVAPLLERRENWCVIPDVIGGTAADNDVLLEQWRGIAGAAGVRLDQCSPVWHPHEPLQRLTDLCGVWGKVCIGGSDKWPTIGTDSWHDRLREAFNELCGDGPAPCWLHLLRGLSQAGSQYPLASADSTVIGQNHWGSKTRGAPRKDVVRMADEIEGKQNPARWQHHDQLQLVPE